MYSQHSLKKNILNYTQHLKLNPIIMQREESKLIASTVYNDINVLVIYVSAAQFPQI